MAATKTYTVKVPRHWASIGSVRAGVWLREYFIRPLMLPADPGAGDRVLRLTLNERFVLALSRGCGDVPAAALRRLLAARVRELPAPSAPYQGAGQRALLVPEPRTDVKPASPVSRPLTGDEPPPSWEPQADPEWRRKAWTGFSAEYKARLLGNAVPLRPDSANDLTTKKASTWPRLLFLALLALVVGLVLAAGTSGRSPVPNPGPRYPLWKPE